MKIPDDIRRTLTDVTEKVIERGQQFGREAQLQVQLKKLQVEHAKKIHELGKRSYDWYRSGTMIVTGPVPADVVELCAQLDATQAHITSTQLEMEEARKQSAASTHTATATISSSSTPNTNADSDSATKYATSTLPALDAPPSAE